MFVLFICIVNYCLVQTCIQKGKLQTAATYLIIIQNLETPVVGKQVSGEQAVTTLSSSNFFCFFYFFIFVFQLATRLLETALEQSSWQVGNYHQTFVLWYWVLFCYL